MCVCVCVCGCVSLHMQPSKGMLRLFTMAACGGCVCHSVGTRDSTHRYGQADTTMYATSRSYPITHTLARIIRPQKHTGCEIFDFSCRAQRGEKTCFLRSERARRAFSGLFSTSSATRCGVSFACVRHGVHVIIMVRSGRGTRESAAVVRM